MTPKVIKAIARDDHTIDIVFSNGANKKYDCKHLLNKGQFKILQDISKFKNIIIDDLGGIGWDIDNNIDSDIVWSNRIDICKDVLYSESINIQSAAKEIFEDLSK
ncbi:MAG: hypothetical protein ACRDD7_09460 [Peptostreptococcaceae bacterium]